MTAGSGVYHHQYFDLSDGKRSAQIVALLDSRPATAAEIDQMPELVSVQRIVIDSPLEPVFGLGLEAEQTIVADGLRAYVRRRHPDANMPVDVVFGGQVEGPRAKLY